MDAYKRLANNLKRIAGSEKITIYQGIVKSIEDITCTVTFGSMDIAGVRLRASTKSNESNLLIVPRIGTPVTVGSLTGDCTQLVVLAVDEVESITINGGKLGGLICIETLTEKINELVDTFNNHVHVLPPGSIAVTGSASAQNNPAPIQVPTVSGKAAKLDSDDYEDKLITH